MEGDEQDGEDDVVELEVLEEGGLQLTEEQRDYYMC